MKKNTCNTCGELKPESEFSLTYHKGRPANHRKTRCKACCTARTRIRYKTDLKYRRRRLAGLKRWRDSHKAERRATFNKWRSTTIAGYASRKLHTLKANAANRGHEVTITAADIRNLVSVQEGRCVLTGRIMVIRSRSFDSISIDRVDWRKGYMPGNVRLVTWQANSARGRGTDAELVRFCEDVIRTHNTRR